ncbi:MAG: RNA-binding protein [Kiritimatiellaeota bacterium]|nr:RNA-binding protein [Kiritimatiellota bacterium]
MTGFFTKAFGGDITNIAIIVAAIVVLGVVIWLLAKKCPCRKGACSAPAAPKREDGSVELYVGNLSYDMDETQFRKEFERFGVVTSARIIGHRTSGKSKGYGFVEMPHRKDAMHAIKNLNGKDIMGRRMRVNEARNGTYPR